MRIRGRRTAQVFLLSVGAAGCSSGGTTPPDLAATGTVRVEVSTIGPRPDVDGYMLSLGGGTDQVVSPNGSATFTGVAPGSHSVDLNGVRANCTFDEEILRPITVVAGETTHLDITISCAHLVYVADAASDHVQVIATSNNSIVATVATGRVPRNVLVSPDGQFAYVANAASNEITVIDVVTNQVVASPPTGDSPRAMTITPGGELIYTANQNTNDVSVIATANHSRVATASLGGVGLDIAVTPVGLVYVAHGGTGGGYGGVSAIETAGHTVSAVIETTRHVSSVATTPDGAFAYVGTEQEFRVVATATLEPVATIGAFVGNPVVAFTPDGTSGYVPLTGFGVVQVIDVSTHTSVGEVMVGESPVAVTMAPDGAHAYVSNNGSKDVSVIATASNSVVATIPVIPEDDRLGRRILAATFTPDGRFAYVATGPGSVLGEVAVIATDTHELVATIEVGGNPVSVAVTP